MKPASIDCPPFLQPGDAIGICAPARKITREELEPAVRMLESWGLYVVFGENLFNADNQFSGTDEERASDLQAMLDDPAIKAVISARGGYGTLRIVDRLDFTAFQAAPKWIIGYSDITVLHSHIHHNCQVATLHATMPINFAKDEFSTDSLRRALFGEPLSYRAENKTAAKNIPGQARGQLVGGNLSLLYALQGSRSDIDTEGKILFLEDLDEYLYHIDRMALSLDRSGKFAGLKGLIVGGMSDMKDNAVPFGQTAEQILFSKAVLHRFPVCFGFPAGHGLENVALPFGKEVALDVTETGCTLIFE
jgi:muramoyltetrapeptide carboxypeptidase